MHFRIEKPCAENYDQMKEVGDGRFCDACRHKVHDFANASADEIRKNFEANNGKICGRVSTKVLQEQYVQAQTRNAYLHQLKVFCWAALFCFGASLFCVPTAGAKGLLTKVKTGWLKPANDTAFVLVKGTVKDKANSELIPFADVVAYVGDQVVAGAMTDIDGNYQLKIDVQLYPKVDLKVAYVGYEVSKITGVELKPGKNTYVDFSLTQGLQMELGIIIQEIPMNTLPSASDPFQSGKTIRRDEYRHMPK